METSMQPVDGNNYANQTRVERDWLIALLLSPPYNVETKYTARGGGGSQMETILQETNDTFSEINID